jgi:hypothetical protein
VREIEREREREREKKREKTGFSRAQEDNKKLFSPDMRAEHHANKSWFTASTKKEQFCYNSNSKTSVRTYSLSSKDFVPFLRLARK